MAERVQIKVPDIGDFHDVQVIEILVKPGQAIKAEQSLITLESDKASMEIPSPTAGVVRELKVKLGDKVSTDDISPSGTAALVFRSNVPAIAEFTFKNTDADFVARARAAGTGILVGGEIYGQGSSREA